MKRFLKVIKALPALLARIAHVIEHIFCDEVPSVDLEDFDPSADLEDFDNDSIAPSGFFDNFIEEDDI